MAWQPPAPSQTWRAIETYLSHAYQTLPPLAVRNRLDQLRAAGENDFYQVPAFERAGGEEITRYSLRLGNRFYPHMKLLIEKSPDGVGALFGADTHDRHVQLPPGSPEAAAFAELVARNIEVARAIEAAFEEQGLPTFKQYLRDDLARRQGVAASQK